MRKAASALICLLGGCVAAGHRGIRPLRPLELAMAPYSETVTEARTGSLMYEGGCLLFRDDAGEGPLLPVWPYGSIFNGTSVIFHSPGKADQPVLVSQHFVMAGQRLPWTALAAGTYAPFQHQCGAQPFLVTEVRPAD